jgi:uncharacterized membrane protein SpoIIM required for sporulation
MSIKRNRKQNHKYTLWYYLLISLIYILAFYVGLYSHKIYYILKNYYIYYKDIFKNYYNNFLTYKKIMKTEIINLYFSNF